MNDDQWADEALSRAHRLRTGMGSTGVGSLGQQPMNPLERDIPDNLVHDPWVHRKENMRCRTCMWYQPKARLGNVRVPEVGRCRRHAPTMNGYPVVFEIDWCGDHKLDEER